MTIQLLGKELETGVLNGKKLEEVWYGGKKVRPIGAQRFSPTDATLLYLPFEKDRADHSGKATRINRGRTWPEIEEGRIGAYFGSSSGLVLNRYIRYSTCNFRINTSVRRSRVAWGPEHSSGFVILPRDKIFIAHQSSETAIPIGKNIAGNRTNFCVVAGNSRFKLYVDGTYVTEKNLKINNFKTLGTDDGNDSPHFYMKDFILENEDWNDQKILDYYNNSKSQFGL